MNKRIKNTITCLLLMSGVSLINEGNFNLLTKKAYADVSTYSIADNGELKSLEIQTSDGKGLELRDDYDGRKKDLTDEKTYYTKVDGNSDGVKIFAQTAGEDYVVKIFQSERKNATPYSCGENISLEKGESTLYIRIYTSEDAFKRAKDNENVTNCFKTYKLNIMKESVSESDRNYLRKITLFGGQIPIDFKQETLSYNIAVNTDVDEMSIKAEPEYDNATVKIDGFKVTEDDKFKKNLHLQEGKNEIKINVIDTSGEIRTYTLNITRGEISNNSKTAVTETSSNTQASSIKVNWNKNADGTWSFYDAAGNKVLNKWITLGGTWYYLKADGVMATGWLNNNGNWYYLASSGAMQTGWINYNGTWYYLYTNGSMARSTTIDGYKIGDTGEFKSVKS